MIGNAPSPHTWWLWCRVSPVQCEESGDAPLGNVSGPSVQLVEVGG